MHSKSLQSTIWAFIFSTAGFLSHAIAIFTGKGAVIIIIAFIYVAPLLLEAMDDLSNLTAENMIQFVIDKLTVIIGVVYSLLIIGLAVFYIRGLFPQMGILWKLVLGSFPSVFLIKKLYCIHLKWVQNDNIGYGYFAKEDK